MQYPQALPNIATWGYPPVKQSGPVDQIGVQRRDAEVFDKTGRLNKAKSEYEDGGNEEGDFERETSEKHVASEDEGNTSAGESDKELSDDEREQESSQRKGLSVKHEETTSTLSRAKKNKMEKKGSSSSSGSNQSGQRTVKFIQPEVYQSLPFPGAVVTPATPIPSGRVIASPFHAPLLDKQKKQKRSKKKNRNMSQSPSLELKQLSEISDHSKRENQDFDEKQFENADSSIVYFDATVSLVESPPPLSEVQETSNFVNFPTALKSTSRPDLSHDNEFVDGNLLTNGLHQS